MYARSKRELLVAMALCLAGLLNGLAWPVRARSFKQHLLTIAALPAHSSSTGQLAASSITSGKIITGKASAFLQNAPQSGQWDRQRVTAAYGKLPLMFEANCGQSSKPVSFISRGAGYNLFLKPNEAMIVLSTDQSKRRQAEGSLPNPSPKSHVSSTGAVLRMKLLGANRHPQVSGVDEMPAKTNYFIGNNPQRWRTNIANYAKVRYDAVYPGIDMIYYGNQQQLEYDFVVAPGADPKRIKLALHGANKVKVNAQGDLVMQVSGGREIQQRKPAAYQETNGIRQEIVSSYVLRGKREIGFQVGQYDRSRPLVIDPVFVYSTLLGGNSAEFGDSIVVDSSGNAYVVGTTFSPNFPIANAFQATGRTFSSNPIQDVFVTKINATGSALVFSTYLGGTSDDLGHGIAVDPSGNIYLTGDTASTRDDPFTAENDAFPTVNAAMNPGSGRKAFVTKMNPTGSALIYSTFLGGTGGILNLSTDYGVAIAADSAGNAYVTGKTNATNFPAVNAFQPALASPPEGCDFFCSYTNDAYVTKFSATGSFLFSTYLGGRSDDGGAGIAVDSLGNVYVMGVTSSTNFPTTPGAFQTANLGGYVFVTKLNAAGNGLVYSTFFGTVVQANALAIDTSGNAYVTGTTVSTTFPTTEGAYDRQCGTDGTCNRIPNGPFFDAFLFKLNTTGTALVYSTYLGGSGNEYGFGIAVDSSGNAYAAGSTSSSDFPLANSLQSYGGGNCSPNGAPFPCFDAFVTKFNAAGAALVYSTFLGGNDNDYAGNLSSFAGNPVAVDVSGAAYITGSGRLNFPTTSGAFQTASGGGDCGTPCSDAFIAKIAEPTNAIDDARTFVTQHYRDFLDREPDQGGLDYWTPQITQCGTNSVCVHRRRIDVSAAFFVELEFQQTGSFVYRMYKASYGQRPTFLEFEQDRAQIVEGPNLEQTKIAFANQWVNSGRFIAFYPQSLSNTGFVNKLFDTAGLTPFTAERQQQIDAMNMGRTRAEVLRAVVEIQALKDREYNPSFVVMQYFGYLQRDPEQGGYDFWLDVLNNREPNNYRGMVCAFITSREYQERFGSAVTRSNQDCAL